MDTWVNLFMATHASAWTEMLAGWISRIADAEVLIVVALFIIVRYVSRKKWRDAGIMALSVGSTALVVTAMKVFFMRIRPENALHTIINDPSFPSGHASMAAAFFVALIAIRLPHIRSDIRRKWFVGLSIFAIFIIGLSRLILNVHWASDVLVGWTIGTVLALISIWVGKCIKR